MAARRVCALALFWFGSSLLFAGGAAATFAATADIPLSGIGGITRTSGPPNTIDRVFLLPAWVAPPYTIRVQNGDASGTNRMVLAWIWVNGQRVISPSDFRRDHVRVYDELYDRTSFAYADDQDPYPPPTGSVAKTITLQSMNTLRVRMSGQPGRYLAVMIFGKNGDATPPQLSLISPSTVVEGLAVPVRFRYGDELGAGEPGASGVMPSTLRVTVDGVDRSASLTKSNIEAVATLDRKSTRLNSSHRT